MESIYIGSAGSHAPSYVNLNLFALPGVDVAANAEMLPSADGRFNRVECDAVLEHAEFPGRIDREIERVLAPGGYAHLVVPFCHPYHAYPADYRRFAPDGLRQLAGTLEVVSEGWRTGPTATLLVTILENAKLWMTTYPLRGVVHFRIGMAAFPFPLPGHLAASFPQRRRARQPLLHLAQEKMSIGNRDLRP